MSMAATSLVVMLGLVLGSLAGIGPNQKVRDTAASGSYCATPADLAILTDVNQHRAANGLPPLVLSANLGDAATYHSQDMATHNYFSHELSDGTGWSQNIRNFGYDQNTWRGENIAAGNSDPNATYQQWLNSPGHNANMLSPNFTAIGIGHASDPASQWGNYWTQTFGGYVDTPAVACDGSDPNARWEGKATPTPKPATAQASRPAQGTQIPASPPSSRPSAANSYRPVRAPRPTSAPHATARPTSTPTARPTVRPTYPPARVPRPTPSPRTVTTPPAQPSYRPVRVPRPTSPPSSRNNTSNASVGTSAPAADTGETTVPAAPAEPVETPAPVSPSRPVSPAAPAQPVSGGVQGIDPQRPAR